MTDSPVPLATHHHPDLSIDQQLALRTAATRLHAEFGEHFGVETIERFLHSSYDQFAGRATVPNFLPLLAERWARQRLTALAESRARSPTPSPPCCSCAPTMQAAPRWRSGSSTTLPVMKASPGPAAPNPATRSTRPQSPAMAEVGIDITREFPKPWTDEIVQAADVVVTMGCGDACPFFPGNATRTGTYPTRLANPSTRSARSVTTSKGGSAASSTNSASPPSPDVRTDRTPSVLFVCVKNGGKSQMAAGLMSKIAGDTVQVYSAGTKPGTAVNDLSAQALAEVGVDITGNTPTLIDPHLVRDVDVVVTLGREAHVDPVPGHPVRELGHRRTLRTRHRRHRTHAPGPRRHRRPRRRSPRPNADPVVLTHCLEIDEI